MTMLPERIQLLGVFAMAVLVPVGMAYFGVSRSFGAHPWWDMKTALIGAPIGGIIGLILMRFALTLRLGVSLLGLAGAVAAAWYGKTQFAASFAENALAGKLWYFGWIGIAVGVSAVVMALLARRVSSDI